MGQYPASIIVRDRVGTRDVLWFTFAVVVVAAVPWVLIDAGNETVEVRDTTTGVTSQSLTWIGIVPVLFVALVWPVIRLWTLLRRPPLAEITSGGVRLYKRGLAHDRRPEPAVDARWDEINRIVVWRLRTHRLWFIWYWRTQVGVELSTDYYEVHSKQPNKRQRESREFRKSGVPKRLGSMMKARSVATSPRTIEDFTAGAARFAPGVSVVDERHLKQVGDEPSTS